jgi:hypothetical protein
MPVKAAKQMASELAEFISNVKTSIQKVEELHRRLETEPDFQKTMGNRLSHGPSGGWH